MARIGLQIRKNTSRVVVVKILHPLRVLFFQLLQLLGGFVLSFLLVFLLLFQGFSNARRLTNEQELRVHVVEMTGLSWSPPERAKLFEKPVT